VPELPEITALQKALEATLVGRRIESVDVDLPKLFKPAPGLGLDDLVGTTVAGLARRGKLLIWQLDVPEPSPSGARPARGPELVLVFHLKLDGQMVLVDAAGHELAHGGHPVPKWGTPMPHKATHVVFHLDDGSILFLTDIRQFGRFWLLPASELNAFIAKQKLSPEPLTAGFTARRLAERLSRRSVQLKPVLLDQSVVGGLGNIYSDEALWRARLNPKRPANSLTPTEVTRLHRAIRWVLDFAVRDGVAFVPNGKAISDRAFPYAHGRGGSPCPRCGTTIVKEWVGGRGTSYCPKCQPEHARAA
jgi:formamidopyrimidine-DNA glycosylase